MNEPLDPADGVQGRATGDDGRRLRRRFGLLHIALPAVSMVWIVAGLGLGITWMTELGGLGLAAMFFFIGALAIRERRVLVWNETVSSHVAIETHRGAAAVSMGLAGIVGGLTLFALAVAHIQGMSLNSIGRLLRARPGLALVPIGTVLIFTGLGFVMGVAAGKDPGKGPVFHAVLGIPSRLGGLIQLAWGVAAAGLGAFELLQPEAFDRAVAAFFGANP